MGNRYLSEDRICEIKQYIRLNPSKIPWQVGKQFGFNTSTAYRYYTQVAIEGKRKVPIRPVFLGSRIEPYQNEDEKLYPRSPLYTAKNRHLITPIREDWKLFKLDYRIEEFAGKKCIVMPSKMNESEPKMHTKIKELEL